MRMRPDFNVAVTNVPAVRNFLISAPQTYPTAMYQWTQESGTGIDGHPNKSKGEIHGNAIPKPQDTYITGTPSRTGRDFTVITGTWNDDYVNPRTGKYEILHSASTGAFDLAATDTTAKIESAEIVLRRGMNPIGNTASATNYFCYIQFAYGSVIDYRFGWEYGKTAHLDFTQDYGATWKPVAVARNLGNTDAYLSTHGNELRIQVLPDYDDNTMILSIAGNDELYNVQMGPRIAYALPNPGRIRLVGENGWVSIGYYPYRYKDVVVEKSPVPVDVNTPVDAGFVVHNSRGIASAEQTISTVPNVIPGGAGTAVAQVGYTSTATKPDAGDGLGSTTPPKIIDATMIFPAVWLSDIGGLVNPNTEIDYAAGMQLHILDVLDDATRTRYMSCLVPINNWRSQYSGTFAHGATAITATNGVSGWWKVFEGIAGVGERGWEFVRNDPMRLLYMPCADYSFAMQIPLGLEVCFDGWCIFSAVRFLAEIGNCHPAFLQTIPLYIPPGATAAAPYGPAGDDCPFYILAKGTGLNARYKFPPEWTPWAVLQLLVQDAGETDPITGENIPYYMGFTTDGQFHFEVYNPNYYNPTILYSDTVYPGDPVAGFGLIEEFHLFNSVAQMRTQINFQGVDAWSNELLRYNITMPDAVLRAIGFRYPWLQRQARFASYGYIKSIADSAAKQASLPTQVVHMKVPYHPFVQAGNVCLISEQKTLGRVAPFYITEIKSSIGIQDLQGRSGAQMCTSQITARSLINF